MMGAISYVTGRPTVYCSQAFYDEIRERWLNKGERTARWEQTTPGGIVTVTELDLYGVDLQVSAALPTVNPRGRVVSLDRFATYEPADMWYAEPLKLARWEPTETHAVLINEPALTPVEMRGTL